MGIICLDILTCIFKRELKLASFSNLRTEICTISPVTQRSVPSDLTHALLAIYGTNIGMNESGPCAGLYQGGGLQFLILGNEIH